MILFKGEVIEMRRYLGRWIYRSRPDHAANRVSVACSAYWPVHQKKRQKDHAGDHRSGVQPGGSELCRLYQWPNGNGPASYNSHSLGLFGTSDHPAVIYPPFEQEKERQGSLWSGRSQYGSILFGIFFAVSIPDRRRTFPTRAFRIYLSCHQSYYAGLFLFSHYLRDPTGP